MKRHARVRLGWIVAVAIIAVVMVVAHKPILRSVARGLIVDQASNDPDAVLIVGGDGRYTIAARVFREHHATLLIRTSRTTRLVKYGILPPGHEMARGELLECGVPEEAIVLLPEDSEDYRSLDCWMQDASDSQVVAIVDRFHSRFVRRVLDVALSDNSHRVCIHGIPDRRYDETNWWHSRRGIKSLVNSYLALGYLFLNGSQVTVYEDDWDPDEYERELQAYARATL